MMSHPPTSSPRTNSWGVVGQFEIAESSWRIRGSGRMSTAAKRRVERLEGGDRSRAEKPHDGRVGRPLHEEDDFVLGDRRGDRFADGVGGLLAHGFPHSLCVFNERAWIGPPISSPKTA